MAQAEWRRLGELRRGELQDVMARLGRVQADRDEIGGWARQLEARVAELETELQEKI